MTALTLPKGTEHALRELTGEDRPDVALLLVLRDSVTMRLQQMADEIRAYEQKYGMSWDAFRQRWESRDDDADYSWESQRDSLEWEGLVTRHRRLEDIYGWLA